MDKKEILHLLKEAPIESLLESANTILEKTKGNHVHIRGLIEFSNICSRNCLYCGLRAQNKDIKRYSLTQDNILDAAGAAINAGCDTIVLQSGEVSGAPQWLGEVVREIKNNFHLPITLSVGERKRQDYEYWRDCGADRYLVKHETADPILYEKLHPGFSLNDRINCLKILKELGYEIGDGFMVGLPGQTLESLADDIYLTMQLGADMCGVGPFIPQKNTPLANYANGSPDLVLRIIAILRLALPNANLPATTALATLDPALGQKNGLLAGANVLMPSFTPAEYAENYIIYDNKNRVAVKEAKEVIESCGRTHPLG